MYLGLNIEEVIDQTRLEKVVLAKKVGQFLSQDLTGDDRKAAEEIASTLADDINDEVRSVLAFELRICMSLSPDIAVKIAQDIDEIALPFLATSCAFSDDQLAKLVPILSGVKQETISRRPDLGEQTVNAILEDGSKMSVEYILRNQNVSLSEKGARSAINKYGTNERLMDLMGNRKDLPLSILDDLITRVSEKCQAVLVLNYKIEPSVATELSSKARTGSLWARIRNAAPAQVHGYVLDLKQSGKLTHPLILDIAERGSEAFLESAISTLAGVPKAEFKTAFSLVDPRDFVRVMKASGVTKQDFEKYLTLARTMQDKGP